MLTEEQIDYIAKKAAERAVEKMTNEAYRRVGKGLLDKLYWIVGVLVLGTYAWAKSKGFVD